MISLFINIILFAFVCASVIAEHTEEYSKDNRSNKTTESINTRKIIEQIPKTCPNEDLINNPSNLTSLNKTNITIIEQNNQNNENNQNEKNKKVSKITTEYLAKVVELLYRSKITIKPLKKNKNSNIINKNNIRIRQTISPQIQAELKKTQEKQVNLIIESDLELQKDELDKTEYSETKTNLEFSKSYLRRAI